MYCILYRVYTIHYSSISILIFIFLLFPQTSYFTLANRISVTLREMSKATLLFLLNAFVLLNTNYL